MQNPPCAQGWGPTYPGERTSFWRLWRAPGSLGRDLVTWAASGLVASVGFLEVGAVFSFWSASYLAASFPLISSLYLSKSRRLIFFVCLFFRAAPAAYGDSHARGLIGATAASLHHSHSNDRSEPRLLVTPQITATLDH